MDVCLVLGLLVSFFTRGVVSFVLVHTDAGTGFISSIMHIPVLILTSLVVIGTADRCMLAPIPSTESWCPNERSGSKELMKRAVIERPYFIISMGPPASGKSSSLAAVKRILGIEDDPMIPVVVDDIVASFPAYQSEIERLRDVIKELNVANPMIEKALCKMSGKIYSPYRGWADHKSNSMILEEFLTAEKRRHVVYESTGSIGAYEWALKISAMAKVNGFIPILFYPYVKTGELLRRARSRAEKEGRLPCPDWILSIAQQASNSLLDVATRASKGTSPMEEIYVFDNNGRVEDGFPKLIAELSNDPKSNRESALKAVQNIANPINFVFSKGLDATVTDPHA